MKLEEFIDEMYMPWAKANKRSWKGDEIYAAVLKDHFKGKALCEISPFLIEKFRHEQIKTPTKNGTPSRLLKSNFSAWSNVIEASSTTSQPRERKPMRGDDLQQAGMFSYLSPEQRVPQDHPLRAIRKIADAVFVQLSPQFDKLMRGRYGLRSRRRSCCGRCCCKCSTACAVSDC